MARLLVLVFVFFLAGCSGERDLSNVAPSDEVQFAEHFVDLVRSANSEAALAQFDVPRDPAKDLQLFRYWSVTLSAQHLVARRVVAWSRSYGLGNIHDPASFFRAPNFTRSAMTVRYVFANDDAVDAYFVLKRTRVGLRIEAFRFGFLSHNLIADNRVDSAKPSGMIAVLVVAFAVAAFVLATLFACLLGPVPRWRWRWLLLLSIPLGLGRITYNWTTGQWFAQLLYLHLPSVVMSKTSAYDPLWISLGAPVFAIFYWSMRWRWLERRSIRRLDPALSQANTRAINSNDQA